MPEQSESFDALLDAMKRSTAALREAGVPFLLGGGLAAWARGGPKTEHDVDLFVKRDDAERALDVLAGAGMRVERPPEDWLVKAYDGDVLVDLIFRTAGGEVTDELFERADVLEVYAVQMRVAALEDVFAAKLLAINEQNPDYSSVLEMARSLREQIDWDEVRARTDRSPFAKAFFTLTEELQIV